MVGWFTGTKAKINNIYLSITSINRINKNTGSSSEPAVCEASVDRYHVVVMARSKNNNNKTAVLMFGRRFTGRKKEAAANFPRKEAGAVGAGGGNGL